MAYDQRIKDYAKALYLMIQEDGSQLESERSIAAKVIKKFIKKKSKLSQATINGWIKKGGWEADLETVRSEMKKKIVNDQREKEEQAKRDREQLLGLGSSTFEISKEKNDLLYGEVHEIIKARLKFTSMWLNKESEEGFTEKEMQDRRLSARDLIQIFKITSETKSKHDLIIAEGGRDLTVTINPVVVDAPYDVKEEPLEIEEKE